VTIQILVTIREYYLLSYDQRMEFNIVRSNNKSPNIIYSDDMGETWTYGGQVTSTLDDVGYVNGYFKYWSNGRDRIDFVCTEHHPRDYNTSIYHGYMEAGKTYDTYGNVMDDNLFDQEAPRADEFSPVFLADTVVEDFVATRACTIELVRYEDGTIASIFKTRADDNDMDHRFFYTRFDGNVWHTTYLGKAGPKLYDSEEDYIGLAAIDPSDPYTIYISTTFDPRDGRDLVVHEIFGGVSIDEGDSWSWYPITENSVRDNLRPIVPAWDDTNTALIWFRGTYNSFQDMDSAVVGLLDMPEVNVGKMHYRDANKRNTSVVGAFKKCGHKGWHTRRGVGNLGSVYASSDKQVEDAPMLKTAVSVRRPGTYDVWVNFWADPDSDWRVKAGLSADNLQTYRQIASQQVLEGYHTTPILLTTPISSRTTRSRDTGTAKPIWDE
jgi:hypothetical protein